MFSVKSLKKLSSGVLFSILVSVMQSSVGLSVESNIKEDNKGAVEISIKKDDAKEENTKGRRILEVVKQKKNIILPLAGATLLVPAGAYGAKKVYDSFYEELPKVSSHSSEKADSVNEPGKSVVEDEVPKSNLNLEDAQNKEENGQGGNESIQGNFTKENLTLSEGDNQGTSEKDALTDEKKQVANGSTDLPDDKDESSKEGGNEIAPSSEKEATSVLASLGKILLVWFIINVLIVLLGIVAHTVTVKREGQANTWQNAISLGFNNTMEDIKSLIIR